jgi:transcriptional regulator with XRE-family HTH domain
MNAHWPKSLGEAVREWRLRECGTQKAATELLSVHQSAICRWESGQQAPDLVALWRAGVSIDALLTRAAEIERTHLDAEACYTLARALLDRPDLHATVTEILVREGAE